jgi:hypothetical protein
MAWRHKNRWFRRWLLTIVFWLVPVMIVAVREYQEEMAYNRAALQHALTSWTFTDAERAAGTPARCHGTPDDARAAGCPPPVLAQDLQRQQAALTEYAVRRATLVHYLWHAFVGYWVVPAAVLLAIGIVLGGVKRALRRPPIDRTVHGAATEHH